MSPEPRSLGADPLYHPLLGKHIIIYGTFSCISLPGLHSNPKRVFATPWTVAYQTPWSMGFSRQEYWSGLPFPSPGDLPNPGIKPESPAWQLDSLLSEPPHNLQGPRQNENPEYLVKNKTKQKPILRNQGGNQFSSVQSLSRV